MKFAYYEILFMMVRQSQNTISSLHKNIKLNLLKSRLKFNTLDLLFTNLHLVIDKTENLINCMLCKPKAKITFVGNNCLNSFKTI